MSPRATISPQARADLDEIWLFIARDNVRAADKFVDHLLDRCRSVAQMPGIGRPRDDLMRGLRCWPQKRYLIFYRLADQGIEIIHIVRGDRDTDALFESNAG